jgi:hypothetical protein
MPFKFHVEFLMPARSTTTVSRQQPDEDRNDLLQPMAAGTDNFLGSLPTELQIGKFTQAFERAVSLPGATTATFPFVRSAHWTLEHAKIGKSARLSCAR